MLCRALGRRWAVFASFIVLFLMFAPSANANGRYPLANQLVARPGDPTHLVARSTFGLLRSDDAGASWTWVCEDALGMLDVAEDPSLALTGDGSTIVAYSQGINVSHDGCTWTPAVGIPGGRFAVDVTVSPARPHDVLAIELSIDNSGDASAGGYTLRLVGSGDDGASWTDVGDPLPGFLGATVEVATATADRVYISGKVLATNQPTLARSDDGGRTFTLRAIAGVAAGAGAFIGGVDPVDPDIVYLRVSPTATAPGRVIVTRDGGATFSDLVTIPGDVSGFALSPDGTTLAVGGVDNGLYVGSTGVGGSTGVADGSPTAAFPVTGTVKPSCLTWVGTHLYACAKEAVDMFSIAASDDGGAHFTPLLHLADVTPADCPATGSAGICWSKWPPIAAIIGADAGAPPAPDAGVRPPKASSGCGCQLGSPARGEAGALALLAALLIARARRRRAQGAVHR
jgi:MYXO-CTERM domain-containing protein